MKKYVDTDRSIHALAFLYLFVCLFATSFAMNERAFGAGLTDMILTFMMDVCLHWIFFPFRDVCEHLPSWDSLSFDSPNSPVITVFI